MFVLYLWVVGVRIVWVPRDVRMMGNLRVLLWVLFVVLYEVFDLRRWACCIEILFWILYFLCCYMRYLYQGVPILGELLLYLLVIILKCSTWQMSFLYFPYRQEQSKEKAYPTLYVLLWDTLVSDTVSLQCIKIIAEETSYPLKTNQLNATKTIQHNPHQNSQEESN